ncbi:MAG: LemA family protein [Chryseobacterium sp.]|nr:MAG: LemA family protein [Chryseobacterium sp.]
MRNKGCISALVVAAVLVGIVLIAAFWGVGKYNTLVQKDQEVQSKWSNIETVYQKRANLIPNLERTVRSYTQFERGTLKDVVEARAKATSINVDPTNMTAEDMARFQQAQGQLTGALSRLMAVVENYPNLKADQQYLNFQREYTAIENSIRSETVYYNDAAKDFNTYRNRVPNNILAGITNFKEKPYFRAEAGAERAPDVFTEE